MSQHFWIDDGQYHFGSDEDLAPIYDVVFASPDPGFTTVVDGGKPFHELVRAFEDRQVLADRIAEYLDDPKNMTVVDFNDLCDIEPACIGIYDLPIGSDIQLVVEPDGRRRWFDNKTKKEISFR